MLRRLSASVALAFIALVTLCLPAMAGGFAVTTLDDAPQDLRANETYRIGYTIRQHGVTPVVGASTRIATQLLATGDTVLFAGRPDGPAGHYLAEVRFPSAGIWLWQVEQGPFAPQQLGTISVTAAAEVVTDGSRRAGQDFSTLRPALPVATALTFLVFARQLVMLLRSSRSSARVRLSS